MVPHPANSRKFEKGPSTIAATHLMEIVSGTHDQTPLYTGQTAAGLGEGKGSISAGDIGDDSGRSIGSAPMGSLNLEQYAVFTGADADADYGVDAASMADSML